MTIQDWAAIAIAISAPIAAFATLLAPSLAEIVKFRINQPKPTPEANQPKNLSQRNKPKRYWIPALLCVFEVLMLIWVLQSSEPVTKALVFVISMYVSSILSIILSMVLVYLTSAPYEIFRVQVELHRLTSARIDKIDDRLTMVMDSLTTVFNNDAERAKKLLEALKESPQAEVEVNNQST